MTAKIISKLLKAIDVLVKHGSSLVDSTPTPPLGVRTAMQSVFCYFPKEIRDYFVGHITIGFLRENKLHDVTSFLYKNFTAYPGEKEKIKKAQAAGRSFRS